MTFFVENIEKRYYVADLYVYLNKSHTIILLVEKEITFKTERADFPNVEHLAHS